MFMAKDNQQTWKIMFKFNVKQIIFTSYFLMKCQIQWKGVALELSTYRYLKSTNTETERKMW